MIVWSGLLGANVGITVYVSSDQLRQQRISGVLASDAESVLPFGSTGHSSDRPLHPGSVGQRRVL
jgi:hypothetical protein